MTPEELRGLFLFEKLEEDKLRWLAEHGDTVQVRHGEPVHVEGQPATTFFVLLAGTLRMSRRVQGDDVEVNRTDHRGVYTGATQAYLGDRANPNYVNSVHAVSDCSFYTLPAADFATVVRRWFPMAMHLLEGLFLGMRSSQAIIGQREQLLALGALSAGLTHELNNPAAAAARATASLRERVTGMRHKLALLAEGRLDVESPRHLTTWQEDAVSAIARAPQLTPMQVADAEDELSDWLDEHGVHGGFDLAPVFVSAGLDVEWLAKVAEDVPAEHLDGGLRWLAYTLETELLMNDIADATGRISALVGAAKQYSQMDRAPHQMVDVHDLLDSTLTILSRKTTGLNVVRDYDRDLPPIPAYAAELNQVWTNLIDNAVQAMAGEGTLTLRTRREDERVLVEVGDTGPGVPEELRRRIFEPFFTTKAVGQGTGLGLDISFRIVVNRHGGDLRLVSAAGDTRFQVRLPLTEPPSEVGATA
ncbi:MAG: cyclic nucleotide-binding domain-containing protein [Geodermatophilaceae bacterium]|nr:cyclic nucleotide-binding domain-containing protein [Geodermatophilaceae bacterium]